MSSTELLVLRLRETVFELENFVFVFPTGGFPLYSEMRCECEDWGSSFLSKKYCLTKVDINLLFLLICREIRMLKG